MKTTSKLVLSIFFFSLLAGCSGDLETPSTLGTSTFAAVPTAIFVTNSADAPLAGSTVCLYHEATWWICAYSDANGMAAFGDLPTHLYDLLITTAGYDTLIAYYVPLDGTPVRIAIDGQGPAPVRSSCYDGSRFSGLGWFTAAECRTKLDEIWDTHSCGVLPDSICWGPVGAPGPRRTCFDGSWFTGQGWFDERECRKKLDERGDGRQCVVLSDSVCWGPG